jgi:hypothetical protein
LNLFDFTKPEIFWAAAGLFVAIGLYVLDKALGIWSRRRESAKSVPVIERFHHAPNTNHPDWEVISFSVRNRDDLRWMVEAIQFTSPRHCKALNESLLIDPLGADDPDPNTIDLDDLSNSVTLNWELAPAGQKRQTLIAGDNDTHYFTIWVYLPRRSFEISVSSSLILRSSPQNRETIKIAFTIPAATIR